jgi:hypothetical protein
MGLQEVGVTGREKVTSEEKIFRCMAGTLRFSIIKVLRQTVICSTNFPFPHEWHEWIPIAFKQFESFDLSFRL